MPAVFAGCASGHTSLEQRDERGRESQQAGKPLCNVA